MIRELTSTQKAIDVTVAGACALLFVLLLDDYGAGGLVAAVLFAAALAARRWSPPIALGLAWSAAVSQMAALAPPGPVDAAILPVVFACASYGRRAVRWAAFASALAGAGIAGAYVSRTSLAYGLSESPEALRSAVQSLAVTTLLTAITLLLAWTLGVLLRTSRRSRRARREADEAGRLAAAERERTRIARDMHDVVAHSLAVVIAQSDGARMLRRTDSEAVDEALETIGSVSRAALADVRGLLRQLRDEGATTRQPRVADLLALLDRFRASGLEVEARIDAATNDAADPVQQAAFRIVQESLTNALRWGDHSRPVRVVLQLTSRGIEVEVLSGLDPTRPARASSLAGHGLIGMRERAASVCGGLAAGPERDHYRVHAVLPTPASDELAVADARG